MQLRSKRLLAAPAALALGLAAASLLGTAPTSAVAAESDAPVWTIQPGGELGFVVMNNGSERIAGDFSDWGGDIRFDPLDPSSAAIHMEIDLASASVGDGFKDKLLQEHEFFSVSAGPTATYQSTSVEALPDGRFVAHGTLSLKGVSLPQDIEFRLSGSGDTRHVEGSASVDRMPFDIGMGQYGGSLDEAVAVNFAFDAKRG